MGYESCSYWFYPLQDTFIQNLQHDRHKATKMTKLYMGLRIHSLVVETVTYVIHTFIHIEEGRRK